MKERKCEQCGLNVGLKWGEERCAYDGVVANLVKARTYLSRFRAQSA